MPIPVPSAIFASWLSPCYSGARDVLGVEAGASDVRADVVVCVGVAGAEGAGLERLKVEELAATIELEELVDEVVLSDDGR